VAQGTPLDPTRNSEGSFAMGAEFADPKDNIVMNLSKAQRLLGEVTTRQNMYVTAAQHFDKINNKTYVVPSIMITAFASFVSFVSSHSLIPGTIRTLLALFVGFLGTIATIISAMGSAYKYDTKAEMFRMAAGEYRLLNTMITSEMRKDPDGEGASWDVLYTKIEKTIIELQKKMKFFPPQGLVAQWAREGKLGSGGDGGGQISAWLVKYRVQLEDDGIMHDDDFVALGEEVYEEWEKEGRYPNGVIMKMKKLGEDLKKKEAAKKAANSPNIDMAVDKHLAALRFKITTLTKLRMQGIGSVHDLSLCSDPLMDRLVSGLLKEDLPPALVTWTKFEELVALVRKGGMPGKMCGPKAGELSEEAEARLQKIADYIDTKLNKAAEARTSNPAK